MPTTDEILRRRQRLVPVKLDQPPPPKAVSVVAPSGKKRKESVFQPTRRVDSTPQQEAKRLLTQRRLQQSQRIQNIQPDLDEDDKRKRRRA
jgi:hypothetical protein